MRRLTRTRRRRLLSGTVDTARPGVRRTDGPPARWIRRTPAWSVAGAGRPRWIGWPGTTLEAMRGCRCVDAVGSGRADDRVGDPRGPELRNPRMTRPGPGEVVQARKGSLAAAQTGQIREPGEPSLLQQLAAVPQALGQVAGLRECAAGDE
jgi:hypothetical protein